MTTGTGDRDFNDMLNQPWPGKIFPELFNNTQDAGDGYPGLQGAIRNWTKDYLHSGGMETGLRVAGNDITGVNLLYVDNIKTYILSEFFGNIEHSGGDFTGYYLNNISGYKAI